MGDSNEDMKIKEQFTRATIRAVIALVGLAILQALIGIIPGTGQLVFAPDVTVGTILFSFLTLLMFGVVLNYGQSVGEVLRTKFSTFPEIEQIARLISFLVVIIWAHQTFWWLPYFRTNPNQYQLVFLVAGVGVGGWLGYLLYMNVDDLSDMLTGKVMNANTSLGSENAVTTKEDTHTESDGGDD